MSQTVCFQGNPLTVIGTFPQTAETAPPFTLSGADLTDVSLHHFSGKCRILNIFPSVDTDVCATSVRKFNHLVSGLSDTIVFCISADLPFAQSRFCGAEGLDNVIMLSSFRSPEFMTSYGVGINEGALKGLAARAVIVIDENDKVIHSQLVSEITSEPDYAAVLSSITA